MNLISYRKVGGLRFIRIGRLQLSFCVTRPKPAGEYVRNRDGSLILENGEPIFCRYSKPPARKRKAVRLPRANWPMATKNAFANACAIDQRFKAVELALGEAESILAESAY